MINGLFPGKLRAFTPWPLLVLLCLAILGGCQAQEPPLSKEAGAFKKEVQDCFDRLCSGLVQAMSKRNLGELNATLEKIEPQNIKLCRTCPFRIAVLNKHGITLTVYPYNKGAMGNFANYAGVAKTLKNHQINQQRLYLQDGSQIYLIFVPLLKEKHLIGIMVLSLSAKDARLHWGLTEREFMKINFNLRAS